MDVTAEPASGRTRDLNIIVACSNRKTRAVPPTGRLRHVKATRASTRLNQWVALLSDDQVSALPASDLYAGEHWKIAGSLTDRAASVTRLWVCSAGYGLIPADAPIRPYSATFSANHPDGVPGGRAGASAWWAALGEWPGPVDAPRSLAQLAATSRSTQILLVLSAQYLAACRDDVLAAASKFDSSGQLSIISAGTKPDPDLVQYLLPSDARLQNVMGGTRQSLNVRIAANLLVSGITDHSAMRNYLAWLLAAQPPMLRYERSSMTDEQVSRYIREQLRTNPSTTRTQLLRQLRESGRACEQHRFGQLYARQQQVLAS